MKDKVLGIIDDGKCPICGKKKVICILQYPLIVEVDMKGKLIFKSNSKRKKTSNQDMVSKFNSAIRDEYQCANYQCESCGWISETYTS